MKKKLCMMLAVMSLMFCSAFVTACGGKGIDFYGLSFNVEGASYTEEFVTEKQLKDASSFYRATINANYYEGMCNSMPTEEDMVAPAGKIFAGWHLESVDGLPWNERNFNDWYAVNKTDENKYSLQLYAKWIDADDAILVLDINERNTIDVSFKDTYYTTNPNEEIEITDGNLDNALSQLPTSSNLNFNENILFGGWSLIKGSYNQTVATKEEIQSAITASKNAGRGDVRLYAIWNNRPMVNVHISVGVSDLQGINDYYVNDNMNRKYAYPGMFTTAAQNEYAGYVMCFAGESITWNTQSAVGLMFTIYKDSYDTLAPKIPNATKMMEMLTDEFSEEDDYRNNDDFEFVGFMIKHDNFDAQGTYVNSNLIEFNEENFMAEVNASESGGKSYVYLVPIFESPCVVRYYTEGTNSFSLNPIDDLTEVVEYNGLVTRPETDPVREGYKFGGWYKDAEHEEEFDFDTEHIITDLAIYAKWTPNE